MREYLCSITNYWDVRTNGGFEALAGGGGGGEAGGAALESTADDAATLILGDDSTLALFTD